MRHKWTIEDAPPQLFLQRQHGLVWDLEALKREMEQPASERRAASLRHALKMRHVLFLTTVGFQALGL